MGDISGGDRNGTDVDDELGTAGPQGAFEGVRVIEVGGNETLYAGKLFADQGAEVVLLESSGGHVSRRTSPMVETSEGPQSAHFLYHNGNKRSVVLPEDGPNRQAALAQLISSADVILAGGRPSEITALGFSPAQVHAINPTTIVTTVTPYGWDGPSAELLASDLTLQAMGGLMNMGGYVDGRPLRPPANQSSLAAGVFAATATAAAMLARDGRERGEIVDVSIQEAIVMALENSAQFFDLEGTVRTRHGGTQVQVGRGIYPCADGFIYLMAGVRAEAKFWVALLDWFELDGTEGREALVGDKWLQRDFVETVEAREVFNAVFERFCAPRTKRELYDGARERGIPMAPVNDLADVLAYDQLAARGFWQPVEGTQRTDGSCPVAPGRPYVMARTPWRGRYGPVPIGAHTDEFVGLRGPMTGTAVAVGGAS